MLVLQSLLLLVILSLAYLIVTEIYLFSLLSFLSLPLSVCLSVCLNLEKLP